MRQALCRISDEHGTGYGEEVTRDLVLTSLRDENLNCVHGPIVNVFYRGNKVDESPIDCVVVEGKIVLTLSALLEENGLNIRRGLSYLKDLNLHYGIAVNFGKRRLQLNGIIRN